MEVKNESLKKKESLNVLHFYLAHYFASVVLARFALPFAGEQLAQVLHFFVEKEKAHYFFEFLLSELAQSALLFLVG